MTPADFMWNGNAAREESFIRYAMLTGSDWRALTIGMAGLAWDVPVAVHVRYDDLTLLGQVIAEERQADRVWELTG